MAEVASVGGFVKQYHVVVDPRRLRALRHLRCTKLREAIRASNMDVGGRTVELAEIEFMVRGRGYLQEHRRTSRASSSRPTAARRCCSATSRASSSGPTSGAASPS